MSNVFFSETLYLVTGISALMVVLFLVMVSSSVLFWIAYQKYIGKKLQYFFFKKIM